MEKRAIFLKHLQRLLEFGREREGVDLSKSVLTHHALKNQGQRNLPRGDGETPQLEPPTEAGGASLSLEKGVRNEEFLTTLLRVFL